MTIEVLEITFKATMIALFVVEKYAETTLKSMLTEDNPLQYVPCLC